MLSVRGKNNNDVPVQFLRKKRQDHEFALDENILHVWCVSLDELQRMLPILQQNLSDDECVRAGRYRFKEVRNRFVIKRGMLRILLSNYLGVDAKHVQFCYGKRGKPRIAKSFNGKLLNFNMSSSENLLLYAFTSKGEVGIDIEYVRPIPEMAQIIDNYFSNEEKAAFHGLTADLQKDFFFRCWTRKEAFLKATGKGLGQLRGCFDILSPNGLLQIQNSQETSGRWYIGDLFPAPGFSAAYAVEG